MSWGIIILINDHYFSLIAEVGCAFIALPSDDVL